MSDNFSSKAILYAFWCHVGEPKDVVDILRLLTRSPIDNFSTDMSIFWRHYTGPVEGAEFMFSQGLIPSEFDVSNDDNDFPPLATALREHSTEPSRWDSFIRLLLRKRADLHMPVPRNSGLEMDQIYRDLGYPCKILKYGTPLDELFAKTRTPFEGEAAAKGWLQILSSEGYDVGSYLEGEQALHAAQMQLTFCSWCKCSSPTPSFAPGPRSSVISRR